MVYICQYLDLPDSCYTMESNTERKAWISFKSSGQETVHGQLETQGLSGEGVPYLTGGDNFIVHRVSSGTLDVSFSNDIATCRRKFVAPTATYRNIHRERKMIYSLDVTAGGLAVSSDSDGKLTIWESQTGAVRRELAGHLGDVYTCRFFPSGVVVLSGGADMQLKIWSAETGKCAATLIGHTAGILDTDVIDRGKNIVSCGRDGTVRLWDCGTQTCLTKIEECGGTVNCCCVAVGDAVDLGTPHHTSDERESGTQNKLLLIGTDNGSLQGHSLYSRDKVFQLDCHGGVKCCQFLSETCVVCGSEDGYITVADIRNIRVPIKEWRESRGPILSVYPHHNGFFTSTGDGSCFYVDGQYRTSTELTGSDCDHVYSVAGDVKHLYAACRDGLVRKYNLSDLEG